MKRCSAELAQHRRNTFKTNADLGCRAGISIRFKSVIANAEPAQHSSAAFEIIICFKSVKANVRQSKSAFPAQYSSPTNEALQCIYRDEPGPYRDEPVLHRDDPWTTGDNRGSTGKVFNTSGMKRESPGRTGNDRRGTGNNRDCTGNNRDCTLAPPGPKHSPAELRKRPVNRISDGAVPVVPGEVPVVSRAKPVIAGPSRSLLVHSRGIEHLNTFPVEPRLSPVKPGRCRSSPR
ncbi:hypothetical protein DPMN_047845 [Dreissena polymorpha]|uniref:Uncharacterized protein n=1 Tax=Dreissena polymorpha TaxID=45954 RepID=A0A9D4DB56_DREPO|nr:hypothetical protein DPMN_047845 [Dreissena polymorpha]